jgi:hypothetical protein
LNAIASGGTAPSLHYPASASSDCIANNYIAYPRYTYAAGVSDGHGWVCVDASNDAEVRRGCCLCSCALPDFDNDLRMAMLELHSRSGASV